MKKVFHPSNERGSANHGWLDAKHSFSFASWYNPEKIHFGALRVLNDDKVAKGAGFPSHPHDNMEIITIPLTGTISHKDSMGNAEDIHAGEIQVMSAGTGILHSEYNPSETEDLTLFQIWIFPNKRNVTPRYDQFKIDYSKMRNQFLQLVSPNQNEEGTWIHQNAWIKMADIESGENIDYKLNDSNNGVYFMNVEGDFSISDQILKKRDAVGISEVDSVSIHANSKSRILAIEVPMIF